MRKLFTPSRAKSIFVLIQCSLVSIMLCAQHTTIPDYVLFSGNSAVSNEPVQKPSMHISAGVKLGANSTVLGGSIGSSQFVQSTGSTLIDANIFCLGTIQLAPNNTVSGRITAANSH